MLHRAERFSPFGVVILLGCAFGLRQLESSDLWWQLHLGRYIWNTGDIPTTDLFTLTAAGNHYIDSHWLFQVGLWAVYLLSGVNGIIFATAAISCIAWVLVLLSVESHARQRLGLVIVVVGAVAASERYVPRPDLVSIALLAAVHYLVIRHREVGDRTVWVLLPIGLVWANTHGLWILGPIVVGAYAVGDAVLQKLPVPTGWHQHAMPLDRCALLGAAGVGMVLVALCTPQPIAQFLYPFTLFREISSTTDFVASSVTEVASPFSQPHWSVSTWAFVLLLIVAILSALRDVRRLDAPAVLLWLAFAYLGWTARRNIPLFAVVAVPIVLRQIATASGTKVLPTKSATLTWAGVAGAVVLSWSAATNRVSRYDGTLTRFGLGIHDVLDPRSVAAHIPEALPGNIWNTPAFGGYLSWAFGPARKPIIDGRWEIYTPEFLTAYGRSLHDLVLWEELARRYDITAVVVTHRRPDYATLLRYLHSAPGWTPIYIDAYAALYVRDTPAVLALFEGFEPGPVTQKTSFQTVEAVLDVFPPRPADPARSELLGNYYYLLQTPAADEQAAYWFNHAIGIDPESFVAHLSLGTLALEAGKPDEAMAHFEVAVGQRPWNADAWVGYADATLRLGNTEGAKSALNRVRRLVPEHPRLAELEAQLRRAP